LDRNDILGAGEAPRKVRVRPLQQGHFRHERIGLRSFWATLDRCQRVERSAVALAAPITQRRRVDALAAQNRTDPTGLGGAVGLGEDTQLVAGAERPPPRAGR
jgi:hypothetical protein